MHPGTFGGGKSSSEGCCSGSCGLRAHIADQIGSASDSWDSDMEGQEHRGLWELRGAPSIVLPRVVSLVCVRGKQVTAGAVRHPAPAAPGGLAYYPFEVPPHAHRGRQQGIMRRLLRQARVGTPELVAFVVRFRIGQLRRAVRGLVMPRVRFVAERLGAVAPGNLAPASRPRGLHVVAMLRTLPEHWWSETRIPMEPDAERTRQGRRLKVSPPPPEGVTTAVAFPIPPVASPVSCACQAVRNDRCLLCATLRRAA